MVVSLAPFIVRAQEAEAFALERQLEWRQELKDAEMGRGGGAVACVIEKSIEADHIQRDGSSEQGARVRRVECAEMVCEVRSVSSGAMCGECERQCLQHQAQV